MSTDGLAPVPQSSGELVGPQELALGRLHEQYADELRDSIHTGETPIVLGHMLQQIGSIVEDLGHARAAQLQAGTPDAATNRVIGSVADMLFGIATLLGGDEEV